MITVSTFKLKEPDAVLKEDDEVNRQSIVTGCIRLEGNAVRLLVALRNNFIVMLDECLDLESLLPKLQGKINSQWYHFGLALGVPNNTLDHLHNYSEDDCLVEVLDYWLKNHPDQPTWKELADAVADLQDYELANSILKIYSGKGKDVPGILE